MDSYECMNDILVNLFRDILSLEELAMDDAGYNDLSMNDWHVIEAIGPGEAKSMSNIAKDLSVTGGSLTIAMNGLCKKGYAERRRSETDRRIVNISLTEKGLTAYREHKEFHRKMIESVIGGLEKEELAILLRSLSKLTAFFMSFKNQ